MNGQTISHFRIAEKLGEGGMGIVYKARDTHLDRFVAIKVLSPDVMADPERKARFVKEAKAASLLNHPNIVAVYDIGQADGIDFIVMEYVEGKTLDHAIARKGLVLKQVLKCAAQIADALAAAHAAGLVHRDLKPSNVMLNRDGVVKVLDFGVAKLTEVIGAEDGTTKTLRSETQEGTVVGTAAYMSPEQAEGRHVDSRSDVFSFGSLLYEMITGRPPFQGDSTMSTLAAIIKDKPGSVREFAKGAPDELERIVYRCLQKDPARRFQHMADLKVELEELSEEPRQDSPLLPRFVPARGIRWMAIAVVASLILIAGFSLGLYKALQRKQPADGGSAGPPVVILMDTSAPRGVYDARTRKESGTNADDLNNALQELPVTLHKETVGSTWDREDQVIKQRPSLIVIHRSAFFYAIYLEFQLSQEDMVIRLHSLAEDKLTAFLGYVGSCNSSTKILVYSRGDPGDWAEDTIRREWVANIERRFSSLKGRVFTISIEGGVAKATFRDPNTAVFMRQRVRSILGLNASPPQMQH